MKTIEERADEFVGGPFKVGVDITDTFRRPAYTVGSTEQKQIDDQQLTERFQKVLNGQKWDIIDKACEWLKARNVLTDASIEGFRKAMEEDI